MARCASLLALLVGPVGALRKAERHIPRRTFSGKPRQAVGEVGQIASLYTYGAPAATDPALMNPGSADGCFDGLRVVAAYEEGELLRQQVDPIPLITGPFGYEHTMMTQAKLFIDSKTGVNNTNLKYASCGQEWPDPKSQIVNPLLHMRGMTYVEQGSKFELGNVAVDSMKIALNVTANSDQQEVAESVRNFGWRLIDSAVVDWSVALGHDSISHLIQEPNTKSCFLTFRGSRSVQDWVHNIQVIKTAFCGFVEESEACEQGETCQVRNRGGSFVHKGFRDHLRHVVRSKNWQTKIRPHLPSCSEVIAVGHSLGGAAAGLFAACAAKDLKPGDFGYADDYEHIGWVVGEPRLLPEWQP